MANIFDKIAHFLDKSDIITKLGLIGLVFLVGVLILKSFVFENKLVETLVIASFTSIISFLQGSIYRNEKKLQELNKKDYERRKKIR